MNSVSQTNQSQPSSRRTFLKTTGLALGAAFSPDLNHLLHAQEPLEKKLEAGDLAKRRGYTGATQEELSRTSGRDIRIKILNSLSVADFLQRTRTARVPEDSLGYVDDLYELAAYKIKDIKDAKEVANILNDIESFGRGIKSARLATLITQATVLEFPIKLQDSQGKQITSLNDLLEPIDIFLKLNYQKMSPLQKTQAENTIIESIYGKRALRILLKKFPVNTEYAPNAVKNLIKVINEIKAKPTRVPLSELV